MNFSSQSLRLLLKLEIWEFKMQIEDCSKQQEADIVLIVLLCVVIEIMFYVISILRSFVCLPFLRSVPIFSYRCVSLQPSYRLTSEEWRQATIMLAINVSTLTLPFNTYFTIPAYGPLLWSHLPAQIRAQIQSGSSFSTVHPLRLLSFSWGLLHWGHLLLVFIASGILHKYVYRIEQNTRNWMQFLSLFLQLSDLHRPSMHEAVRIDNLDYKGQGDGVSHGIHSPVMGRLYPPPINGSLNSMDHLQLDAGSSLKLMPPMPSSVSSLEICDDLFYMDLDDERIPRRMRLLNFVARYRILQRGIMVR